MKMTGEYRIPAPRQEVWEALNDPEILQKSVPGCESIEKVDDETMEGVVQAKVGPVKAKFKGTVKLRDMNPPESYTLSGEGKGGAAGFAKGNAKVNLEEAGDAETVLKYEVDAQVGGKLAQIGQRLIDSTAKKLSDEFFGNFAEIMGGTRAPAEEAAEAAPEAEAAGPSAEEAKRGLPTAVWIAGLVAVVVVLLLIFAN